MSRRKYRPYLIILLILYVFVTYTNGQLLQTERHEINITEKAPNYEVIPYEGGVVILSLWNIERYTDSLALKVEALDKTLTPTWSKDFKWNKNLWPVDHKSHQSKVFMLFRNKASESEDLTLLEIETNTGLVVLRNIPNEFPLLRIYMQVTDQGVLIGGYFNGRLMAMYMSLIERSPKILPGLFEKEIELKDMMFLSKDTIEVTYINKKNRLNKSMSINSYNTDAQLINTLDFSIPHNDRNLITGRKVAVSDNTSLLVGTYGYRKSEYSLGVYTAKVEHGRQIKFNYYEFSELNSPFKYVSDRKERRIKRALKKNKAKQVDHSILDHFLINDDTLILLLGTLGQIGNDIFIEVMPLAFDKNGKLLSETRFKLKTTKFYSVKKDNNVSLVYAHADRLYAVPWKGTWLDNRSYNIETTYKGDEITKSSIKGMRQWDEKSLIVYGFQHIKNNHDSQAGRFRIVFFINKIELE